ncbi:MAG: aminotransferase class V-fold PLP-dependent enzyme, partial [Bacteroidales bacterium]|nr:aminotransferase class V-fold PLP-dependent enzyme [Bacteroidales bacterium]
VPVLVDGAQGIQHGITDVQKLDCDFYVFSGHKIYGPAGTGVLYGKNKWLSELPPYQGGGDMVANVTFDKTTYNELPFRFEAGTTNFPGAIGLASALGYVDALGRENIAAREKELLGHAINILTGIPQLRIIGNNGSGISTISFLINGIHPYDTGMILDKLGVAVRTGAHCAQPVMDFYEIEGTVRASLCFYNTIEEINLLGTGIEQVIKMFS